jgi:hypothetical protein
MANPYLTSDTLIESVARRASIPEGQQTFEDVDFLAFANEEIQNAILPLILSMNEEYYVTSEDISLVASQSNYAIPYRAIGGKLRDVFYKDTQGNLQEMTRISPDDRSYFQASNVSNFYEAYYIQGNDIILCPNVSATVVGSLTVSYYLRPNQLVAEDRVATITAINIVGSTTVYTVDLVPDDMTVTSELDILQAKPGFKTRDFDLTPSAVDSAAETITFLTANVPAGVVVGDHITFASECKIPQIPVELHSILAERVAARCLEAMGDQAGLQAANQKLSEMEQKSSTMIDNRVEGAPMKINNHKGLVGSSRIRRRRF